MSFLAILVLLLSTSVLVYELLVLTDMRREARYQEIAPGEWLRPHRLPRAIQRQVRRLAAGSLVWLMALGVIVAGGR